ncbi:MAG: exo-alpha-sialidase [Spirosomataceae bacterium]
MITRRNFITSSLSFSVSLVCMPLKGLTFNSGPTYRRTLESPARFFDGESCWTHPRIGIIPHRRRPLAVLTMSKLDLEGSDVFREMVGMHTTDLGKTWEGPYKIERLCPTEEKIGDEIRPIAVSDFWPSYHKKSGKLLGIGHTVVYTPDWKVVPGRPRHTAYAIFDEKKKEWLPWKTLEMPDPIKFANSGAGSVQRFDKEDGSILLPFYFTSPGKNSRVAVALCQFEGSELKLQKYGNELSVDDNTRGLHEPSMAYFKGTYFLTIRNDKRGYITRSRDGLNYEPIVPWTFDDGSDLGNYNTQQHWVTHKDGLFLVYTRRGANNDHVFRHRAPLFMAQVDPEKLCVIRETEQILVPERGARLGNFGVTYVSPQETWVTVSEWMQPKGVEKYGSDGTVYIARIHWDTPNK